MSAKSALTGRIGDAIRPMTEAMGFQLVRVKLSGGRRKTLQVMAERPDGRMSVDDCAELSQALSALLDVEDLVSGEYSLEVSSPGIDRPLIRERDYRRFCGHLAKINLALPLEGRKKFVGTIAGVENDEVILELKEASRDQKRVCLPLDRIDEAKLVLTDHLIEFSQNRADSNTE